MFHGYRVHLSRDLLLLDILCGDTSQLSVRQVRGWGGGVGGRPGEQINLSIGADSGRIMEILRHFETSFPGV